MMVACTQGTGIGGLSSMQTMFHGNLLGQAAERRILQEVLPNVVADTWFRASSGPYGAMVHPVGACAPRRFLIEEASTKIRLGKAGTGGRGWSWTT